MPHTGRDVQGALEAWRRVLGEAHVATDAASLVDYTTATFATTQTVAAALRPADREQVQACMRIANERRVPVYPTSRGKSWGLGSRVPVQGGGVVMDLGRLDRIVELNEELGYAVVEPGVTFQQMFTYLRERKSNLMMCVPGTSPEASLIGNALERGHGFGPHPDRFSRTCAMEVVLPTGECIHTGFDRFGPAAVAHVHRYGVGPHVDGLFTQSNLGIVTRMTVWLEPVPNDFQSVTFALEDAWKIEPVMDALRTLMGNRVDMRINNGAGAEVTRMLIKRRSMLSAAEARLSGLAPGKTVRWLGRVALYSDSVDEGKARARDLKKLLGRHVDAMFFKDRRLNRVGRALKRPLAVAGVDITGIAEWHRYDAWLGVPSFESTTQVYAMSKNRFRTPADVSPERDGCGVVWACPAVPFTGKHVRAFGRIVDDVSATFGVKLMVSLHPLTYRSIDAIVGEFYDRSTPGADERAMECFREVHRRMSDEGYLPYRLGTQAMDLVPEVKDDYGKFLRALKTALDPNDILAPGRYDFRGDWS